MPRLARRAAADRSPDLWQLTQLTMDIGNLIAGIMITVILLIGECCSGSPPPPQQNSTAAAATGAAAADTALLLSDLRRARLVLPAVSPGIWEEAAWIGSGQRARRAAACRS